MRIGRIGRAAAESGDFRGFRVDFEHAWGPLVRCRSKRPAPIEEARWLGWQESAAGTNAVEHLAVEES